MAAREDAVCAVHPHVGRRSAWIESAEVRSEMLGTPQLTTTPCENTGLAGILLPDVARSLHTAVISALAGRSLTTTLSRIMASSLAGKTALVTGGSKGIGFAAALSLSEARARVAICSRNVEELKKAAAELELKTGHRVLPVTADVTSQADVGRLIDEIQPSLGGIDIVGNNAGQVGEIGAFENMSTEIYGGLYDLNVVSIVRLVKAVLPATKAKQMLARSKHIFREWVTT
jgi:NADPH:quinone reductase-like Zn-dependent oxidoreductase